MENSLAHILACMKKSEQYKELLELYNKYPESVRDLSNQLAKQMSTYQSVEQEVLADFIALSKLILKSADSDLQTLHTVCILKVIPLEYYKLPDILSLIYEIFCSVKDLFNNNVAESLYSLLLKQAKNVYSSFLHYSKSLSQPHGVIKEVIALLFQHGKIREADMYFMNRCNSVKEWIGYLYLLKDMSNESTTLGNLMLFIFQFQLKCFLSSIFPKAKDKCFEKVRIFEWLNELTSFAIKDSNKEQTMKFVNKLYRSKYKDNEAFKKANSQNVTANQETGLESALTSSLIPAFTKESSKTNPLIEEDKVITHSKDDAKKKHAVIPEKDDLNRDLEEREMRYSSDGSLGEDNAEDKDTDNLSNNSITRNFTSLKNISKNTIEEDKTLQICSKYGNIFPRRNIINRLHYEAKKSFSQDFNTSFEESIIHIEPVKSPNKERLGEKESSKNLIMSEAGIVSCIDTINNRKIETNFTKFVVKTSKLIDTKRKDDAQSFFESIKSRYLPS